MRRGLLGAVGISIALVLTGCGDGGDDAADEPTTTADAGPVSDDDATTTTAETTTASTTTAPETTTTTAATGPQVCGTVTSTIGTEVVVEIVAGAVDCTFAEDLLDTYYNAPPTPPEGSGAYVTIGEWECNSSSSQEPGRASTCRDQGDGVIISQG